MHIPNAVLDPSVTIATGLIGALGLGYALRKLDSEFGERSPVLLGTTAAFVFAGQMVNFSLGPLGVSGHLLGGVLAATVLGPWGGSVVIASVLIIQCFFFGDGGLLALGANFVNMGLIGSSVGYLIYKTIRKSLGGSSRGILLGATFAAWISVILASGAFSIELAASGRWSDFSRVLSWMALVHAGIGVGEALITGIVVKFLLQTRPDLIYNPEFRDDPTEPLKVRGPGPKSGRFAQSFQTAGAGLAVALAIGIFLAPFASEMPDGLEYVGDRLGFIQGEAPASLPVPIQDYAFPGLGHYSLKVATAAAGGVGTLIVFVFGLGLTGLLGRTSQQTFGTPSPNPEKVEPDAA